MFSILHRVGIRSSTEVVYSALTTQQGLAGWWTSDTRGTFDVGGVIAFRFGTRGFFNMKVLELEVPTRIVWEVIDGPDDWIGTKTRFDLKQEGEQATLLFKHEGWKEQSEFMHHCSTKWASFLMSLKSFVETGKGAPYPDDVRITINWD